MALLRGDPELYKSSLLMTQRWVTEFFDPEANATQAIGEELTALLAVKVKPTLPDISRSLQVLLERQQDMDAGGGAQ